MNSFFNGFNRLDLLHGKSTKSIKIDIGAIQLRYEIHILNKLLNSLSFIDITLIDLLIVGLINQHQIIQFANQNVLGIQLLSKILEVLTSNFLILEIHQHALDLMNQPQPLIALLIDRHISSVIFNNLLDEEFSA